MSDIIQLLPDAVANQIAAGEVIQRPASVIKELVENAVDAEAKSIQVMVVDAGRTSIQVVDDGKGMSETDARLAFERHATSKIRQADDLFALQTMGFRGEALASIAAVAQVELKTRTNSDEIGTLVSISGSKIMGQEPVSCPVGCNITVKNLFYNVPARRKFLKSNATELSNILTAFERIVLVYPDIHFTLYHNGAELLNLKATSLRQRIVDVFGKQYAQDLMPVDVDTAICRVYGYVAKPETARKKAGCDHLFVNGRFMKHPYFHKAVISAYDRLIPEGMQVPYFLYFEVNPADIDVNIHPTKTEIKFENEQAIWQILMAAVRDAIGRFCGVPSIDFDTVGRPDIPVFNPVRDDINAPKVTYNPDYNPFRTSSGAGSRTSHVDSQWQTLYDGLTTPCKEQKADGTPSLFNAGGLSAAPEIMAERSPVHYQYKGRYMMTAVKSGLMIIDQHRADLRVLYERFLEQQRSKTSSVQKLLFPDMVEFSASEAVVLDKILQDLVNIGFDVSHLGGHSYALNGVPAGIEGVDAVRLLQGIVSDALEAGRTAQEEICSGVALSLARRAAIPYGQVLSNEEMENLINELFACSNVNYTPDGKTILYILPQDEIEHRLG
jgi:DNA mismatch repair protein MutL